MKHLVNWVEIPVINMEQAKTFYTMIFGGIELSEMELNDNTYAFFPTEDRCNTGALVRGDYYRPSADGITIYLDGGKDMDQVLQQVEKAGGEIIMPKTFTGEEAGYVGMFIDSEGNKIGLQHF